MRKVEIQELSLERFGRYGCYANMINPDAAKLGAEPLEFFRDMVPLELGNSGTPMFSICRVCKRPGIIDATEYHSFCSEGNLPLDSDIVIHVGIATPNDIVPLDEFEVFRVPRGTFFTVRPGVWHHAPFAYGNDVANTVVVLPERTYANDCEVYEIPVADRIEIAGL